MPLCPSRATLAGLLAAALFACGPAATTPPPAGETVPEPAGAGGAATGDETREPPGAVRFEPSRPAPAIAPRLARAVEEGAVGDYEETREALRGLLELAPADGPMAVGGTQVWTGRSLLRFYEARGFAPAFIDEAGELRGEVVRPLTAAIRRAAAHGLRPADYHVTTVASLGARLGEGDSEAVAAYELILADAFLTLAAHLLQGKVDPVSVFPSWTAGRRRADLLELLRQAIEEGRMAEALAVVATDDPSYTRLVDALARYRAIAHAGLPSLGEGEWSAVPDRAAVLRRHLRERGDLVGDDLADGLRSFQRRHGLRPTGEMNAETLAALRVPVGERMRTIRANLDRWRWLPEDLGERQVRVNIAGFEMRYIEDGEVRLRMRAIVGKPYRKTPVFSDLIRYVVLNPSWTVPLRIVREDLLPELRADPEALGRRGLQLFDRSGGPVRGGSVDWQRVASGQIGLRQPPGPDNALGPVKFMFPNSHDVYLHGTPRQSLFDEEERTFSSGCIRLERPLELAEALLRDQQGWSREQIDAVVSTRRSRSVPLVRPVPVHLLYATAWVEPDGTIHFRRDVYERDEPVLEGLAAERSATPARSERPGR